MKEKGVNPKFAKSKATLFFISKNILTLFFFKLHILYCLLSSFFQLHVLVRYLLTGTPLDIFLFPFFEIEYILQTLYRHWCLWYACCQM